MVIEMDKTSIKQPIYWQSECLLTAKSRGFDLITKELQQNLLAMPPIQTGLIHFFLQHTSASLAISENASQDVADDLETYFSKTIPEDNNLYRHTVEGEDDMPAHIKNVILGTSLTIPIKNGQLALGQWQGIYLCEHRNQAPRRCIIITAHGL